MDFPHPKDNELKDDFIGRCMRERVMVDSVNQHSQRKAVCNRLWNEHFELAIDTND